MDEAASDEPAAPEPLRASADAELASAGWNGRPPASESPEPVLPSGAVLPAADAAVGESGAPRAEVVPAGAVAAHAPEPQPWEEERARESAPNYMLAFVCAVAALTSLNEGYDALRRLGMRLDVATRNHDFLGYSLLGAGLLAFGVEALSWGKRRRTVAQVLLVLLAAGLTIAGVVFLLMSGNPGRRI